MKNVQMPKLEDRTIFEKILFGIQLIISISVIITGVLGLMDILNLRNGWQQILLGCMFFIGFLQYRKYNTLQAIINLAGSVIIFAIVFIDKIL